ncbi:hypothetical protein C9374_007679 [Naegleria lovaniensis]|uniref:Uncharacterized protein n=1 Tax=Naegleria lovaniensis TaxID=51637 RepID=A0AA88GM97_NAELO|nr:uncharacterized protein C9374_007679 [Naegleria lovaniensis]KAG2379041.1 hypothetical protein C9374_007679 [Naegleria lovaniensis]
MMQHQLPPQRPAFSSPPPPMINNNSSTTTANTMVGTASPHAQDFMDRCLGKVPGSQRFWDYCFTIFMLLFVLIGVAIVLLVAVFYHNRVIFIIDSECNALGKKDIILPSNLVSSFWKRCQTAGDSQYPTSFNYALKDIKCMKSTSYGRVLNTGKLSNLKKTIVNNVVSIADTFLQEKGVCDSQRATLLKIQNKYKTYAAKLSNNQDVNLPKYFKTYTLTQAFEQALATNNANQKDSLADKKVSWYSTVPEYKNIPDQDGIATFGVALSSKFDEAQWDSVLRHESSDSSSRLWVRLNLTETVPLFTTDNFDHLTNFVVSDTANLTQFYEIINQQVQDNYIKGLILNQTDFVISYTEMRAELMLLNLARINSGDRGNVMAEASMIVGVPNGDSIDQRILLTWGDVKETPQEGILQRLAEGNLQSSFMVQGFSKDSVFSQDLLNVVR